MKPDLVARSKFLITTVSYAVNGILPTSPWNHQDEKLNMRWRIFVVIKQNPPKKEKAEMQGGGGVGESYPARVACVMWDRA